MRLTLRTMLAYLDDLLEPSDAQAVKKKIDESEFATSLMHRMRDVTRRLRLGSPKLHGRGMGLDPNTVAEYLDNTLLSERVADFEKVCLESDVHLAEVASCHQILALVLGEPAEIQATGRQRMYEVVHQTEATADSRPSSSDERKRLETAARSARRKKKRRRPKVPDYLREPATPEPTRRRWAPALVGVALLAATGIGLWSYWPAISQRLQVAQQRVEPPENTAAVEPKPAMPAVDENTPDNAPAETPLVNDRPPPEIGGSDQTEKDTPEARVGKPADTSADMPEEPPIEETEPDDKPIAQPVPASQKQTDTPEVEEKTPAPEGIGRLTSEHGVLLRAVDGQWQRVPDRIGTVYAGDQLIALPTYRPSVTMSSGVSLELLGGAMVSLGATDDDGVGRLHVTSGRVLLLTVAKPGTKLHLQAGDYAGTIEFGKEQATLAVEVQHVLPEGADPEEEAAPTAVDLYLTSGQVTWIDKKGRGEPLRGRAHRSLSNRRATGQASDELPVWIEQNELNPMDRRASTAVENFLRGDKVVGPTLIELLTHRQIENTVLAAQCLTLIDEFEPIVPLLNDSRYRGHWPPQVESLRAAIARGPKTAALVREAFETVRGKKLGDPLYRMLWGYSSEQMEEGAAVQLIDWLDAPDEQLDYRVLSFWNLHHITGFGQQYRPELPQKQRRTSIQHWKQKLDAGLIIPKAT
jgi:hypothetical protein